MVRSRGFSARSTILLLTIGSFLAGCDREPAGRRHGTATAAQGNPTGAAAATPQGPSTAIAWTPDEALLQQLEPYQDLGEYEIRPPKGYRYNDVTMPGEEPIKKQVYWSGPARADKSKPQITVMIMAAPANASAGQTTERTLNGMLPAAGDRGSDWQQTPVETGKIGDLTFCGCEWRGTVQETNSQGTKPPAKRHGAIFTGRIGDVVAILILGDTLPESETTMKTLTASVMTFRKKQ